MTRLEDRQILIRDIAQAHVEGARLAPACALAGIDVSTLRRWKPDEEGVLHGDRRPDADRPVPSHALSEAERAQIITVANEPRFADTPPARIVPALADDGIYLASESSFHRDLIRLAGSLKLGHLKAAGIMRTLQVKDKPTTLARALSEIGRIAKTVHILHYVDDAATTSTTWGSAAAS